MGLRGVYIREVLKDDSGWFEWNFDTGTLILFPVQNVLHVMLTDFKVVAVAYSRLQ